MPFTIGDIAAKIGGEVLGDSAAKITGIASADKARPGELTFAESEKYLAAAEASEATGILVSDAVPKSAKALIKVANVRVAVAQLLVTLGSTLLNVYVAGRVLKLSAWSLFAEFRTAAVGSCAMVAALVLLLPLLAGLPKWAGLAAGVLAGAAVYVLAAWVVGRETVELARATVLTSLRRAA